MKTRLKNDNFIELLHCGTFETFISENPEKDVNIVKSFLNNQNDNVLIIKSEIGNGGTHLLSSAGNELLKKDIRFSLFSCSRPRLMSENEKIKFEKYLKTCKYFLIDSINAVFHYRIGIEWLGNILSDFIKKGGKVILTSHMTTKNEKILELLKVTSMIEVKTSYQPLEILKKIGEFHASTAVVNKFSEGIVNSTSNIREYVGFIYCHEIRIKLDKEANRKKKEI